MSRKKFGNSPKFKKNLISYAGSC